MKERGKEWEKKEITRNRKGISKLRKLKESERRISKRGGFFFFRKRRERNLHEEKNDIKDDDASNNTSQCTIGQHSHFLFTPQ